MEVIHCDNCGCECEEDEYIVVDDEVYCPDCYEDLFAQLDVARRLAA